MRTFKTIRLGGETNSLQVELTHLMLDLAGELNRNTTWRQQLEQTAAKAGRSMAQVLADWLEEKRRGFQAAHRDMRKMQAPIEASDLRVSLWSTSREVCYLQLPRQYAGKQVNHHVNH